MRTLEQLQKRFGEFLTEHGKWYWGIKHMTCNGSGYVYWKGTEVEHYTYLFTEKAHNAAKEIAKRCLYLESINIPVNCTNIVWHWDKFKNSN